MRLGFCGRSACSRSTAKRVGGTATLDVRQLLMAGSVYLTRTGLNAYAATPGERRQRGNDVLSRLAEGKLDARVDSVFQLEDAAAAHRELEGHGTIGKVLLLPQQRKPEE